MALKLPRLQRTVPMVGTGGVPSITFHIWFDKFGGAIEGAVDGLDAAVLDIQATQAALVVTQGELATAQAGLALAVADIAAAQDAITLVQDDVTGLQATVLDAVLKDQTPAWVDPTGTLARVTFGAYAGQVVSNPPTDVEVQAIDDHMKVLSQTLAALVTDLRANGVLT